MFFIFFNWSPRIITTVITTIPRGGEFASEDSGCLMEKKKKGGGGGGGKKMKRVWQVHFGNCERLTFNYIPVAAVSLAMKPSTVDWILRSLWNKIIL